MSPLLVCSTVYLHSFTDTFSQAQIFSSLSVCQAARLIRKVSRIPMIGVQNIHVPFCLGPD